jgi:hypothetical protein
MISRSLLGGVTQFQAEVQIHHAMLDKTKAFS